MNNTNLFEDFTTVSAKAWKQKIQYDLNGADYNKTLIWQTPEDINVKPFYNEDDFKEDSFNFKSSLSPFKITQTIYVNSEEKSNTIASHALDNHADAILFIVPTTQCDLNVLLKNINLSKTPIYFNVQFCDSSFVSKLNTIAQEKEANFYLNFDIIGHLITDGNWYKSMSTDFKVLESILKSSNHLKSNLSINLIDYQNAGATIKQQLAYGLAHANEYLNRFSKDIKTELTFKVAIGSNYFFEIAKIRALRMLWHTLASAYNINTQCHILATPTKRNKTIYSSKTNISRLTTEYMSAILGGADSICNVAHHSIYRKQHNTSEQNSRNQLHLLKQKNVLGAVCNPSDGSYYIENLTQQLAEKALELFKDIEANGGILKLLKEGLIQKKIKESADKEQALFDSETQLIIGANTHSNSKEKIKEKLELYPFIKHNPRKTLIEPIIPKRLAEHIEQNKLQSEK
ncbi:methylmalonyl-CoA mutase [Formosa sediminum]|uniref:Methylmalonyl-CoA mutase n=1 Tax=Formosa sediminum TaxID=2594004 RepID=A0A516GVI2_9FLAO|nr:methylmalonyl-CoA mutase subunit beta [Formosa sediminum]QDO95538.1 methylmalonyl-CoA mutase [Formosa sediminum]